jgi:hypothetical protein
MRVALVSFALLLNMSCHTTPAARSPLREALAAAARSSIEEASTACFTATGWKVDPIPSTMADAEVLKAVRGSGQTELYIHGKDMTPRLNGGPDDNDPFWDCLTKELNSPGSGVAAMPAAAGDAGAGTQGGIATSTESPGDAGAAGDAGHAGHVSDWESAGDAGASKAHKGHKGKRGAN